MTNEIIEFYREHLKPIIQKMLLETNYQGQGEVDYEEFGRDFDELLDLAIIGMQSNSDGDCISREQAIRIAEQGQLLGYEWQFKELCKLSSIQPKPKATSKWQRVMDGAWFYEKCTACNTVHDVKSNYCPNCGAKMEGSEDGENI